MCSVHLLESFGGVFGSKMGVEFSQNYLVSNTLDHTLALPLYIL